MFHLKLLGEFLPFGNLGFGCFTAAHELFKPLDSGHGRVILHTLTPEFIESRICCGFKSILSGFFEALAITRWGLCAVIAAPGGKEKQAAQYLWNMRGEFLNHQSP